MLSSKNSNYLMFIGNFFINMKIITIKHSNGNVKLFEEIYTVRDKIFPGCTVLDLPSSDIALVMKLVLAAIQEDETLEMKCFMLAYIYFLFYSRTHPFFHRKHLLLETT